MTKMRERILERKKKEMERYREEREAFEKVMGKPKINVSVELPKGYETQRKEFLRLEEKEAFLKDADKALDKVVKKHLKKEHSRRDAA